jgi:multiple sugar transport system permease protein
MWEKVQVELHPFLGISVEAIESDTLAIAGGRAPDVLYVNFRKSDHYIQSNFLYPLDKPEDNYLTTMSREELDSRVNAKIWPVIRRAGPDKNEHVWAMPYGGALGTVLLYRKDLFDAHNLAHPDTDWTWDDMLSACRKITDPTNGIYGLIGGRGQPDSWFWFNYLWSAGAEVMEFNKETGQWRCVFDSLAAAESLDFFTKLNTEAWTDSRGKERRGYTLRQLYAADAWERGEAGMCIDYLDSSMFARLNPDLTGIAPMPKGPRGTRGNELNSKMMGLSSLITSSAVRDAAWEYIRFYDSDDALRIKTQVLVEGGMAAFVNPVHLRRYGYADFERLVPPQLKQVHEAAITFGRPEPYGPNASYILQIANYPVHEVEELAMRNQLPADRDARLKVIQAILQKGVARAEEQMLGRLPAGERSRRDRSAYVFLIVASIAFIGLIWSVGSKFNAGAPVAVASRKSHLKRFGWAYLLLLPAGGTILLWQYFPLLRGSAMAFQDYQLQGQSRWVGVQNFADLLYDPYWWRSVWNALRYTFLIMALTFLPPIVLAILLQEVPRGSTLFRVIYYFPAVLSGLVTMVLWKQFYDPSESGVLNAILLRVPAIAYVGLGVFLLLLSLGFAKRTLRYGSIGVAISFLIAGIVLLSACIDWAWPILFPTGESTGLIALATRLFHTPAEPYRWLSDPNTAMLSCVIPMVWASIGPGSLIYLAALKGISDDYYEAADLDGATFLDKVLFVVFPILRPLILINFTGVFIGSWYGAEANILALTGGAADTEIAGLHIFYKAFQGLKFGPAAAMAWVLAFMLIGFTVYQLRLISRMEFRAVATKK